MNSHPNEGGRPRNCLAVHHGWFLACTRPRGHSGPHAASSTVSGPFAMWRQS